MKQPNDTKTADIFAGEKRGRGRPKLDNAKSAAERARQYRLNKKTRPQVARPLAAAADEIEFLRGQVEALSRDLHNAEIRARLAEDSFDEQLAEISRLRSELDKCDASQKTPIKTSARIDALSSMNAQLVDQLRTTELRLAVAEEYCDLAPAEILRMAAGREAARKSEFKTDLKSRQKKSAISIKSDASQKTDSRLEQWPFPSKTPVVSSHELLKVVTSTAKKPSRKAVTKIDSIEQQFDYPE